MSTRTFWLSALSGASVMTVLLVLIALAPEALGLLGLLALGLPGASAALLCARLSSNCGQTPGFTLGGTAALPAVLGGLWMEVVLAGRLLAADGSWALLYMLLLAVGMLALPLANMLAGGVCAAVLHRLPRRPPDAELT